MFFFGSWSSFITNQLNVAKQYNFSVQYMAKESEARDGDDYTHVMDMNQSEARMVMTRHIAVTLKKKIHNFKLLKTL